MLRSEYGCPLPPEPADPIDFLVRTVLSQNTNDLNSHRAYERLRQRFHDWESVRKAPAPEIQRAIRIGGLAKTKTLAIKRILIQIRNDYGALSLRSLCGMTFEDASAALAGFKGVGPKTINCVLLFGCGMNVFPVDTHILRLSKRLGIIPETATAGRAHELWATFLPKGLAYSLHLNLIEHGRRICHARTPLCTECCLRRICEYYISSCRSAKASRTHPPSA